MAKDYPNKRCVYRLCVRDPKQRAWFVFDHTHVLPEYIVEFEYMLGASSKLMIAPTSSAISAPAIKEALELLEPDLRRLAAPLGPWLALSVSPDLLTTPIEEDNLCRAAREVAAMQPVRAPHAVIMP